MLTATKVGVEFQVALNEYDPDKYDTFEFRIAELW